MFNTPEEVAHEIAERVRDTRLSMNLSQEGLARRTGVSTGTIKRFEKTGQISFVSLLKIALVVGVMNNFENVFKPKTSVPASIDDLINEPRKAQRGRLK